MLEYLFMFPIAAVVSAIAMAFGIGGAAIFTPIFIIALGLPAPIAAGAALIIEVFGFSSGMFGFVRKKLIDYKTGMFVLYFTVPSAIVGVYVGRLLPHALLEFILALVLIILAILISHPNRDAPLLDSHEIYNERTHTKSYTTKQQGAVKTMSVFGGLLAGMVSSGSGEVNDYLFLNKYRMPGAIAAGTSVFVLSWTVLLGSVGHTYLLLTTDMQYLAKVMQIVLFAVPGVVIGAQVGVSCASMISEKLRKKLLSALFFALSSVTLLHLAITAIS